MVDGVRTHRERKEQYIRTLEADISRLRESYSNDMTAANASLQQQREVLQSQEDENNILKELLALNGIPYEAELAKRKAARQPQNINPSHAGSTSATRSTGPQSSVQFLTTPGTTASSNTSPGASAVDLSGSKPAGGTFPQGGFHAAQNEQPGISEFPGYIDQGPGVMTVEMPGVFEKDPQLGIEFILTYVLPTPFQVQCALRANNIIVVSKIPAGIISNLYADLQNLTASKTKTEYTPAMPSWLVLLLLPIYQRRQSNSIPTRHMTSHMPI